MRVTKVTCDGCGHDLTITSNMVDYRLLLTSENKPGHEAGAYTAMGLYPPIDRDYHFCRIQCLDYWRDRERFRRKLWAEWSEAWKEAKGRRAPNGHIYSWPSAPPETQKAKGLEIDAATEAAFPFEKPRRPRAADLPTREKETP